MGWKKEKEKSRLCTRASAAEIPRLDGRLGRLHTFHPWALPWLSTPKPQQSLYIYKVLYGLHHTFPAVFLFIFPTTVGSRQLYPLITDRKIEA